MPNIQHTINSFNELTDEIIHKDYLPTMYDLSFRRQRSWLANDIPRSNENVDGLQVFIQYLIEAPWSWRAMSEFGYTPTGAKYHATEGWANLGCHAANAIVSLHELESTEQGNWVNILSKNMNWLSRTFPLYLRGLLWSSQNSKHALGKVGSVSGTTITLDGTGMWYSQQSDRAFLFEPNMFIQAYSGNTKVGDPMKVEEVDKPNGTVTVDKDPGLSAGNLLTFSDIAGMDQPYEENMPGVLDVIDDDNVFQGIDRASQGKQFQAHIEDATGLTLNYELLSDFFYRMYNPGTAHTSREIVKKYWQDNLQGNVQYTPGGMFVDGYEGVRVDGTRLVVDDDVPHHDIIVPDHGSWQIADRGGMENLFNKGWERIPGRPFLSYDVVYWCLLMATDTRYFGRMTNVTESA